VVGYDPKSIPSDPHSRLLDAKISPHSLASTLWPLIRNILVLQEQLPAPARALACAPTSSVLPGWPTPLRETSLLHSTSSASLRATLLSYIYKSRTVGTLFLSRLERETMPHPPSTATDTPRAGTASAKPRGARSTGTARKAASESRTFPGCQVTSCHAILTDEGDASVRFRTCNEHRFAVEMDMNGVPSRYCQQCTRVHALTEFDGLKRGCRRRLNRHNMRRQRKKLAARGDGTSAGPKAPSQEQDEGKAIAAMAAQVMKLVSGRLFQGGAKDGEEDGESGSQMGSVAPRGSSSRGSPPGNSQQGPSNSQGLSAHPAGNSEGELRDPPSAGVKPSAGADSISYIGAAKPRPEADRMLCPDLQRYDGAEPPQLPASRPSYDSTVQQMLPAESWKGNWCQIPRRGSNCSSITALMHQEMNFQGDLNRNGELLAHMNEQDPFRWESSFPNSCTGMPSNAAHPSGGPFRMVGTVR